jgi:hypothetical protein
VRKQQRKANRANLIDAIKGMNEAQLHKISKILKVRINKVGQDTEIGGYDEEGPNYEGPSSSVMGDTEADELYDRVEELQVALA